ncbi:MAG: integration host factor subunit beta [Sphingobacteriia bacterium]|nr:integration host factor subunit beta [Sphingobacteriia bacterium]
MNKHMLSLELVKIHAGITQDEARNIIDIFFNEISSALLTGRRIEIRGFGSFSVRKRKARTARNPKTNIMVDVTDMGYVYFRPSKELLMRINAKKPKQVI